MNSQAGFEVPVLAVLCDGNGFHFYKFDEHDKKPRFLKGTSGDGQFEIPVPTGIDYKTQPDRFFGQNRCVSEVLYYVFLVGYVTGLEAHWNLSVAAGKAEGQPTPSIPVWHKALDLALESLKEATRASMLRKNDQVIESQEAADRAHQLLIERYVL